MARVIVNDATGCWEFQGAQSGDGYAQIFRHGKRVMVHRASYEMHVGPIPEGLTLDHLCRVRHCVNPEHLEPVTMRENTLRGTNPAAQNARKTHCPRGHAFKDHGSVTRDGRHRVCLACNRERCRRAYRRRKALAGR